MRVPSEAPLPSSQAAPGSLAFDIVVSIAGGGFSVPLVAAFADHRRDPTFRGEHANME
jgi:hypothetical protein